MSLKNKSGADLYIELATAREMQTKAAAEAVSERDERRRRIEHLQCEIDQSRVAEAMANLDLAHLDVCRFRLDEAEAHIADAFAVLGGIEGDAITVRAEYLRGEIAELRKVVRR